MHIGRVIVLLAILCVLFQGNARSEPPIISARCTKSDLWREGKYSLLVTEYCELSMTGEEAKIEVACKQHWGSSPEEDEEREKMRKSGEMVYISHFNPIEFLATYNCDYERRGGAKVLVCKGWIGALGKEKTFTEKEFQDTQIRCNRLCGNFCLPLGGRYE